MPSFVHGADYRQTTVIVNALDGHWTPITGLRQEEFSIPTAIRKKVFLIGHMRDLTLSPADIPRKRDPVVTGIRLPCNSRVEGPADRIIFANRLAIKPLARF